jgi:Ser/Thr protein kinase RdoA (MazF antagonist)
MPPRVSRRQEVRRDLLVDRFFLVNSLSGTKLLRHEVAAHYRERGKAAGRMGELMASTPSSTHRTKSHWFGKKLKFTTPEVHAFASNVVQLLISRVASQVTHIARRAITKATGTDLNVRRLR